MTQSEGKPFAFFTEAGLVALTGRGEPHYATARQSKAAR